MIMSPRVCTSVKLCSSGDEFAILHVRLNSERQSFARTDARTNEMKTLHGKIQTRGRTRVSSCLRDVKTTLI